jgi:predicted protein tyrosine phosphatase
MTIWKIITTKILTIMKHRETSRSQDLFRFIKYSLKYICVDIYNDIRYYIQLVLLNLLGLISSSPTSLYR